MTTLPQCPCCDAANTLRPVSTLTGGVIVCDCSCCSATVHVRADGAVIWSRPKPRVIDAQGNVMDGP